jgi:hypothetical protein
LEAWAIGHLLWLGLGQSGSVELLGWPLHFNRTELMNEINSASATLFVCCLFAASSAPPFSFVIFDARPGAIPKTPRAIAS